MFNNSVGELIKIRTSWRTYEASPIPEPVKEKISEILKLTNTSSPFPGECRFEWFNMNSDPAIEKKQYGTYGFIEGARNFILGAASNTKYGYRNI